MQVKFVPLTEPALIVQTLPGYHIVKSKKGYCLANNDMVVISFHKGGIWFEEYVLIGSHENIVWLMTGDEKTCMFNIDNDVFTTVPRML